MEYFRIKDWEKYQHRDATRHKGMPWIKFYTASLIDHRMSKLTPSQFGLWARLMLCAGQLGNKLPLDPPWLASRLHPVNYRKPLKMDFMWELGLIEKIPASLDKIDKIRLEESASGHDEEASTARLSEHAKNSIPPSTKEAVEELNRKLGIKRIGTFQ